MIPFINTTILGWKKLVELCGAAQGRPAEGPLRVDVGDAAELVEPDGRAELDFYA